MSESRKHELSAQGAQRREQMLGELIHAVDRTRRRRRAVRLTLTTAGGLALIGLLFRLPLGPTDPDSSANRLAQSATRPPSLVTRVPAVTEARLIQRVTTRSELADHYRVHRTHLVERIDDDRLIATLVSIDRPAGIIRYGARVELTGTVDDASLEFKQ